MTFLTSLQVALIEDRSHSGRGTWRVEVPLMYADDRSGPPVRIFAVPAGFVTDFASVPRLPFAFMLLGDTAHEAATLHDWLYSAHPVTRTQADLLLWRAALDSGVPVWRAALLWFGVRIGGASHW